MQVMSSAKLCSVKLRTSHSSGSIPPVPLKGTVLLWGIQFACWVDEVEWASSRAIFELQVHDSSFKPWAVVTWYVAVSQQCQRLYLIEALSLVFYASGSPARMSWTWYSKGRCWFCNCSSSCSFREWFFGKLVISETAFTSPHYSARRSISPLTANDFFTERRGRRYLYSRKSQNSAFFT